MEEEMSGAVQSASSLEESFTPVVVTARIRPMSSSLSALRLSQDGRTLEGFGRSFRFDRVLGPGSSQEELYELGGPRDFLPLALDGYDLNFLAYGERKSGKSYSLFGGIFPAFLKDLFARLPPHFSLKVSFIDILDEHILDLLSADSGAPSWISADSPSQVIHALQTGLSIIRKRPLDLFESSTSHSIFSMKLITQSGAYKKTSLIRFIDLAGSDVLTKKKQGHTQSTTNSSSSSSIGGTVDLGLLSLVNVVSALGDPRRNVSVIPYADSALTRVIREAFGGNAVTLLLATLLGTEPEATLNTCMFAELASHIKNHPSPHFSKEVDERRDSDVSLFRSPSIPPDLCFSPPLFQEGRPPEGHITHAPIPIRPPSLSPLRSPLNVQMYLGEYRPSYDNSPHRTQSNAPPPFINHNNNNCNTFVSAHNYQNAFYHGLHNYNNSPPTFNPQPPFYPNANNILNNAAFFQQGDALLNAQLNALSGQLQRLSTANETQSPIDILPSITSPPPVCQAETPEEDPKGANNNKLERIEEESEPPPCSEPFTPLNEEDPSEEEEEDFDSEAEDEPFLEQIVEDFRCSTRDLLLKTLGDDFYDGPPERNSLCELRRELSDLTASHIESQNAIFKTDKDLNGLQAQLKELKSSIQVKENLIADLLSTEAETKAINKKFKYKLRLLEEKSHHVRKDLRGAHRLIRELKGASHPGLQLKVQKYNEEIKSLEEKITDTERVLQFSLPESPETQEGILGRMKEEHAQLQDLFQSELSRKTALEEAVSKDKIRIQELEIRLKEQAVQLNHSLRVSQDLEKQRDQLQFEAQRLQSQIQHCKEGENKEESKGPEASESCIRQEISSLRNLKDDLLDERSLLETRYQSEKRSGNNFSRKDEYRIVELDVILEAMDSAIELKNAALSGIQSVPIPSNQREEILLSKLSALSMGETQTLLRKFVYRTIDLRTEGNRSQVELDLSEDERHRLYRKLQELNYHYSSREVAYERKLDIQKTEHLKQLSVLRKQINDPDAYEYKLKQLKDELVSLKQDSQKYKRFYKAYHKSSESKDDRSGHPLPPSSASNLNNTNNNNTHIRSNLFPNTDMPPPQKVTRERKKLIVQSKAVKVKRK